MLETLVLSPAHSTRSRVLEVRLASGARQDRNTRRKAKPHSSFFKHHDLAPLTLQEVTQSALTQALGELP